ncbi:MAG TPA: SO2930 family diheme c-type cytochrome [Terriglobia bacterium]|nr:SO2930 family diheme c-type cytochrome [Terriglobia bacterium]
MTNFRRAARAALGLAAMVTLASCQSRRGVQEHLEPPFPGRLSAWRLFRGQPRELHPNHGVVPYDINTPLFSDYADKFRFVWMPPGTSAAYRSDDVFDFPVGTILSKTFGFRAGTNGRDRLIETRLLVHARSGWVGLPYVWNRDQTEATLDVAADPVPVRFVDSSGHEHSTNYMIPNSNQCKECHARYKVMGPLGPKARNLNKTYVYSGGPENELAHWTAAGYLKGSPDPSQAPRAAVWDDPFTGAVEARARAYLDINCGTCHRPGGAAATSALYLDLASSSLENLGVCKTPVAAGHASGNLLFDIVPGSPEESILIRRMESTAPKVMMPEIARSLPHAEGIELVRAWVTSLGGTCAAAGPPLRRN